MKTIEQRTQFDDFELEEHYDFSDRIRGRFYQSKKITETIQFDDDILLVIKKQASEQHLDYQILLNMILRDYLSKNYGQM